MKLLKRRARQRRVSKRPHRPPMAPLLRVDTGPIRIPIRSLMSSSVVFMRNERGELIRGCY